MAFDAEFLTDFDFCFSERLKYKYRYRTLNGLSTLKLPHGSNPKTILYYCIVCLFLYFCYCSFIHVYYIIHNVLTHFFLHFVTAMYMNKISLSHVIVYLPRAFNFNILPVHIPKVSYTKHCIVTCLIEFFAVPVRLININLIIVVIFWFTCLDKKILCIA